MGPENKNTVAAMVREHNSLNGFGFVIVEFFLVVLAALFICTSAMLHGRLLLALTGAGIAVNAVAVMAIACAQLSRHEQGEGLSRLRSSEFRARLRQTNPKLSTHTFIVFVSTLIPLLLVVLLSLQWHTSRRGAR